MSLEAARSFLYRVLPWGDPGVYYNIHWTTAKTNKRGRPFVNGRACMDLDEAVQAVHYAQTRTDGRDIYVCLSSQAETAVAKNGMTIAARSQRAAVKLKSLFVDIDVKPDGYPDQRAALLAFKDFLDRTSLPLPTVMVSSGTGGVHAYWTLDTPLTVPDWQPLANALAEATRRVGLKVDTQCTVDAARIMRVPGTLNYKRTPPLPVELGHLPARPDITLGVMRQALAPYMGATVIPLRVPGQLQSSLQADPSDRLSAGLQQAPPVNLDLVASSGCGFVAEALATGGAGYANPLWNLSTLLAVFTDGHRDDAHRMAHGHASYDSEETDELFERKERERESKNLGWPSCASIQNAGCTHCATCPHLALGRSPLHLGMVTSTVTAPGVVTPGVTPSGAPAVHQQDADLPGGWVRDAQGLVYKRVQTVDGVTEDRKVLSYPLYGPWLQEDPWAIGFVTRFGNPVRERRLLVPSRIFQGQPEKLAIFVGEVGLQIQHDQRPLLKEFLVSWVQHLQSVKGSVLPAASYGWSVKDGKVEGFCYDQQVWLTGGGSRPTGVSDPILARLYLPQGDVQKWLEASRLITDQKRPGLDTILAVAFAAPLVRLTGQGGLFVSVYSESGAGKSSAVKVSQSVWGHPVKGAQMLDDTNNSVLRKLGELKSLPMYWDELKTDEQTEKFVALAFALSGGKGKSRLNAESNLKEVQDWQTIMLAASNESILDHIARRTRTTTAGALRVFEFKVPKGPPTMLEPMATRIISQTHDNFGHAGLAYAQFLGANHERIALEVAQMQDAVARQLKSDRDERFWVATVATLWAGARYANQLGFTQIDEQALVRHLFDTVEKGRQDLKGRANDMTKAVNVGAILSEFLGAMRARHTLTTKRINIGAGRPQSNNGLVGDHRFLEEIIVQIGRDDGIVRMCSTRFRDWLRDRRYAPAIVVEAMKETLMAREMVGIMGGGTEYSTRLKQNLIEINFNTAELARLMNDDPAPEVTPGETPEVAPGETPEVAPEATSA